MGSLVLVLVVPIALMMFALAMERVEARLAHGPVVAQDDVEEFLDSTNQAEVAALAHDGFPHAHDMLTHRQHPDHHGYTSPPPAAAPRRTPTGPANPDPSTSTPHP